MSPSKPLEVQQASEHLDQYFQKIQKKAPNRPLQVQVAAPRLGFAYSVPSEAGEQPFHTASVGKLFTAVLVMMLAEKGVLSTEDLIERYFSHNELDRLFVYKGKNYSQYVTIEQLLGHTSGIADYFEGKTVSGNLFMDEVLSGPQHRFTPHELIKFTRDHQKAVGSPGQKYRYSDTGYILLGLIVEKVTGKPFDQNLKDELFAPLEMRDSYLMFYGEPLNQPRKPIEKIWFNDREVSGFESLSCDWSGGGIVSTTADLIRFNAALREGRLIPDDVLRAMDVCTNRFMPGIYYGLGMMEIRFKEFFILMGKLPKVYGHIGILSTHLFYDPTTEAHVAMNFGSNTRMIESFKALIEIETTLQRIKNGLKTE